MSLQDKIAQFNPDGPGDTSGGIFGLPFHADEASTVIVPVPWEVTVSYRAGTASGPKAILAASPQIDLFDETFGPIWESGIAMLDIPADVQSESERMRPLAQLVIEFQEAGGSAVDDPFLETQIDMLNDTCTRMVEYVKEVTSEYLEQGKKVILLGGDHSTPLGLLQALAERHKGFGILQIDAHMDLRDTYEGFTYSHASVMHNALQLPQVTDLVQVGIRDFAEGEYARLESEGDRLKGFTMRQLRAAQYEGRTWKDLCGEIIAALPDMVYVSFDIDGLDPGLCPNTGTPVPGGLGFDEVTYLMRCLKESGKEIIGADLVEVAPGEGDEFDGMVGARILYLLCGLVGE